MWASLQAAIQRVVAGSYDEADLRAIAHAIHGGHITWASGDRAVSVGGSVVNSLIVSGSNNNINNTIVLPEGIVAAIEAILAQQLELARSSEISLDEWVQQARSHAADRALNLFSKICLLNKRQIEVDRLYVDVYVLEMREHHAMIPGLLEGLNTREQFDRLGLGGRGARSSGLAIAASESFPRLMVLGKPGSGKSTFLRHLVVSCAKGELLSDYIPILLELRDVDEAAFSLLQWVHTELGLEQEAQTEQVLKQGRVLILLDGLDEVPSSLRQRVQNELRKFVKRYDKNRFILTCRTQTTKYIPEYFQPLEVADFKPEQVERFALNWFTAVAATREQGATLKDHFMEKLRESPQTAELSVNPVLLSLTCWIFDDLQCLPQKRSELYQKGLDLLLQQWDEGRGIERDTGCDRYRQLNTEQRRKLLSYLAVRKFEQEENFILFEESEICGYIAEYLQISVGEGREVLQAIAQQHGLLIERAQGIWSFSHLTFQEYLVSKWFCDGKTWAALAAKIKLPYWHEIFLLTTELYQDTSELLKLMKENVDKLVESEKDLQLFLSHVYKKSQSLKTPYHSAKIRALYFNINQNNILGLNFSSEKQIDQNFDLNFESVLNEHYAPECVFDCELSLLLYEAYWLKEVNRDIDYSFGNRSLINRLSKISVMRAIDEDLVNRIQELQKKLPNSSSENWDAFKQWWNEQGHFWADRLRELLINYRGIRYDLQSLKDEQWNLLRQYYAANQLLVTCLNSSYGVIDQVREEIEETLLLPIAEIEKRKRQSTS